MSDKERKKAHVEEIELEIPISEYEIVEEEQKPRIKKPKNTKHSKKKNDFLSNVTSVLSETAKIGMDVAKSYKDEFFAKKHEKSQLPVKPNSALLNNPNEDVVIKEKLTKPTVETEGGEQQKPRKESAYKPSITSKETGNVKKQEREHHQAQEVRRKKKKRPGMKKKPSNSLSAKSASFIELFEKSGDKKSILSDKDFRKFVSIATALIVLFGAVWYGFTYLTSNDIPKIKKVASNSYPGPIKPSNLFVSRTPEVIELLGDPKASGSIDGTKNSFFEYEDNWFGSDAITKIVYGEDKRVYSVDIAYKSSPMAKVYPEMVKYLGEPITNSTEKKEAEWVIDSSQYKLSEEGGKAMLKIQVPFYENANGYPIGKGAIIIQKQGGYDITGDKKNDVVVIIGEKENYLFKEFTKLHITIWDGENVYYKNFPADSDGGANPKVSFEDVNKDGLTDVSVESKNNAINNYNSFTVKNREIANIYTGHEKKSK